MADGNGSAAAIATPDRRRRRVLACLSVACNVALSAYLGWQLWVTIARSDDPVLLRFAYGLGTGVLAVLVLFRSPARAVRADPLSIAAIVVSNAHFFAFDLDASAPPAAAAVGAALFVVAGLWASVARLYLGRSYSLLPALHTLRSRGPYAVVRHPIYLALAVVDVGTVLTSPSLRNALVAAAGIAGHVVRVELEERVLARDPAHVGYCAATRSKLVPGLY